MQIQIILIIVAGIMLIAVAMYVFTDDKRSYPEAVCVSDHPLYRRSQEIMASCVTHEQFMCAERWKILAIRQIKREAM